DGMFQRAAECQVGSGVLCFALGLSLVERTSRGRARFTETYRRGAGVAPTVLRGWRAALAIGACLAVLGPGFFLPVGQLGLWTLQILQTGQLAPAFGTLLLNTLYLAGLATGLACFMAVVLAYARRLHSSSSVQWSAHSAAVGGALPRSLIALGGPLPLAWLVPIVVVMVLDRLLGHSGGLLLTGSAVGLIFPYLVRFLAVSLQTVDASLTNIPPSLDDAARSLGASGSRMLRRVHLPLM